MERIKFWTIGILACLALVAAVPSADAQYHGRYHHRYHHRHVYYRHGHRYYR